MDRQRLDFLVAKKLGVSRSLAVNLIETGKVKVNGKLQTKPSCKINEEDKIWADMPEPVGPADFELPVIYEDDDCVVIDKPAGVLTHSKGAFSPESTVASWLLPKTTGFDENNNRAGITHRLDRATSGVMICAKTPEALTFFQKQFSSRKVKKTYYALITGQLDPAEAIIDIPIERNPKDPKRFKAGSNGKPARTTYKTVKTFLENNTEFSLLQLTPKTGRTHQLRVHLAYLNHPIVGDDFYGGVSADRLYLHASSLELTLPDSSRQVFSSALPDVFSHPKINGNG